MFAGWFARGRPPDRGGPLVGARAETLVECLQPFQADARGRHIADGFAAVASVSHNTAESRIGAVPFVCPRTGRVACTWSRLDNRRDLAARLGLNSGAIDSMSDGELVLALHDLLGPGTADALEGDFALVIWDPRGQVYAARDCAGAKPLFYSLTCDVFAFATSVAAVAAQSGVDADPRPEWLAQFIAGCSSDHLRTALNGVMKLPPGHWLVVDHDRFEIRRYDLPPTTPGWTTTPDPRAVTDYRAALDQAVVACARSDFPVGIETSGGLDTSSILGVLAAADPGACRGLHTFGAALHDVEPGLILQTSAAHGIEQNHILTSLAWDSPEFRAVQQRASWVLGQPVQNEMATLLWPLHELAQSLGVRTMLSGHGGDETVTTEGSGLVAGLVRQRKWRAAFARAGSAPLQRALGLRRATAAVRRSRLGAQIRPAAAEPVGRWVSADASAAAKIDARVLGWSRSPTTYPSVNDYVLDRRGWGLMTTRTEECSLVAATYRIDYRWPLLDRRLFRQFLQTAEVEKANGSYGRFLHRRAVADVVPESIAWRATKGVGAPLAAAYPKTIDWGAVVRAQLPALMDSPLRHVVDADRITKDLTGPLTAVADHEAYRTVVALDWLLGHP
jgi:asparagine synthase (glutamine-hydrolysing)